MGARQIFVFAISGFQLHRHSILGSVGHTMVRIVWESLVVRGLARPQFFC